MVAEYSIRRASGDRKIAHPARQSSGKTFFPVRARVGKLKTAFDRLLPPIPPGRSLWDRYGASSRQRFFGN